MPDENFILHPIGRIRSALRALEDAPRQGNEGGPDAWVELDAAYLPALADLAPGDQIVLITFLHRADRSVLKTHPRNDPALPLTGVFATRSPDRPNPVGLHRVVVREVASARLLVGPIEAIDGTPVVDIKPVLHGDD